MENILQHGQFYGETRVKNSVGGLVLAETAYPAHLRLPRHSHRAAYFCFILYGSYTEVYGSKTRECHPFTLAFHPPAESHSENFYDAEVRSFNVEIQPSFVERVRVSTNILDRGAHLQGGVSAQLAMRLYKEFCHMDSASPLAIEGLVLELIAVAARGISGKVRRKSDSWLKTARDLLHSSFRESLSLTQVADNVNVHPVHLAREFRRSFRCTIGEYVRQLRIEYACQALSEGNASLNDIALDAGFFDQSHFCRVFRKLTGMTPQEYRYTTSKGARGLVKRRETCASL